MATQWYYESHGRTHGPLSFRELVEMARAGSIGGHDRVRSDWDETWRWAETVPGLFYMARRAVASPIHAGAVETANQAEPAASAEQSAEAAVEADEPGWLKQLLIFRSDIQADESRTGGAARRSTELETDGAAGTGREAGHGRAPVAEASGIRAAAKSALDGIERRESRRQRPQLIVRLSDLPKLSVRLALVFPWVCSLAAGNAAAYVTLKWSEAEALRFPNRDASSGQWTFPLYGECGALEYVFLLGNLALLAAAVGYGVASVLQTFTDE